MEQEKDILGKKGEDLARIYLQKHGFRVLHQNWRYGHKEIDIVARKDNVLHVVEVKTRTSGYCEDELHEAVGRRKQKHLVDAAEAYILDFNLNMDTQFDLVFVVLEGSEVLRLDYIPNAFGSFE